VPYWFIINYNRTSHSTSHDGWVSYLGMVGVPSIFGLARRAGAFTGGLVTFALVSGFHLTQHNGDQCQCHFRSAAFSSELETMVAGTLTRAAVFRVVSGVGGDTITSGSHNRPSHSWTSRLLTSSFTLSIHNKLHSRPTRSPIGESDFKETLLCRLKRTREGGVTGSPFIAWKGR